MDKKLLTKIVSESYTYSEVLRKLKLGIFAGNYDTIKKYIIIYNLDISHFNRKNIKNLKNIKSPEITLESLKFKYLKNPSYIKSNQLKLLLIKFNLLAYECSKCKNTGTWQNEPLIIQLDHKDGNKHNNEIQNLRLLCPNCHTQTSTYSGKNIKSGKKIKTIKIKKIEKQCPKCNGKLSKSGKICMSCYINQHKQNNNLRNKLKTYGLDKIINELKNTSYCALAKKFNVSDNSIRKIIKSEGYCPKTFVKLCG